MSEAETSLPTPLEMPCPKCGWLVCVTAVQGDRCPACRFEFTLFEPGQDLVAHEFYEILTGEKHFRPLPNGMFVVVHR